VAQGHQRRKEIFDKNDPNSITNGRAAGSGQVYCSPVATRGMRAGDHCGSSLRSQALMTDSPGPGEARLLTCSRLTTVISLEGH
jgi:hypothetical protein